MSLNEIQEILKNKLSPKIFKLDSEIYGFQYSNNKNDRIVRKVMLTVDLSIEAIHFALQKKINLIISHHSLVQDSISIFHKHLINKLILLNKYPISIFVLNSSFIAAEGGGSDIIVNALYLNCSRTFNIKNNKGINVPIGRICLPKDYLNNKKTLIFEDLIKRTKTNLNLSYLLYVGDLKKKIEKICIVGGHTPNTDYLIKALNLGCDCYITGNINYFDAIFGRDAGLLIIETSHYPIENLALKKLCNVLSLEFPYVEFFLFESSDPFKIYC